TLTSYFTPHPPPSETSTLSLHDALPISWSDAVFDLAHGILGSPHREADLNRTAITTVVILFLWMLSAYKIYRVVSRLSYLESFRSEEHTSELQSRFDLVCRLLLEKKNIE